jgi:HAE1 family hydrophobic/amphiphilic exporter-1
MSIAEISVKRYVFAAMVNLLIILFGIISVNRISIDRSPDIDFSLISVTTILPGANPDVVDSSVTNIVEGAVNSISGIEDVRSRSAPGVSNVFAQFFLEKTLETPGADLDLTSSIPEILLTAPSTILVTLESTTSGFAPGRIVVTEMSEKSMSGDLSIDIRFTEMMPNKMISRFTIAANT